MKTQSEPCSVLVVMRDRLSTTSRCLEALLANTPEPFDLIVLLSCVPDWLKKDLEGRFGHKARFIFEDRYLNQAECRNRILREAKTRLAAIIENDVYVRPGWLPPLIDCFSEKKAALVMPIVLEQPALIHTAGNDLFITYRNGHRYAQKVLRYAKIVYFEGCDLQRSLVDYGELHCQLMSVEQALSLAIFDERLHEDTEIDSGLIVSKNGGSMWFEPKSVVHFDLPERITKAEDIRTFIHKWDIARIIQSDELFQKKWGLDLVGGGNWPRFIAFYNQKLGFFSRLFPSRFSVSLDNLYHGFKSALGQRFGLRRMLKKGAMR